MALRKCENVNVLERIYCKRAQEQCVKKSFSNKSSFRCFVTSGEIWKTFVQMLPFSLAAEVAPLFYLFLGMNCFTGSFHEEKTGVIVSHAVILINFSVFRLCQFFKMTYFMK